MPTTSISPRCRLRRLSSISDKGFRFSLDWRDSWQEQHAVAFTVAKAEIPLDCETMRPCCASNKMVTV
jgi:hypothetical protein